MIIQACASHENKLEAQTHFQVGLSLFQDGRYPDSLSEFKKAHDLSPDNPDIVMHIGLAYLELEKLTEAEATVKSACAMKDPFPECWNNLSYVEIKGHKFEAAEQAALRALSTDTYATPNVALGNLARAQIELRQFQRASTSLNRALRLNPSDCRNRLLLSLLHTRAKRYAAALQESKRTVFFCRDEPQAYLWEAYGYYKTGNREAAAQKYRDITDLFKRAEAVDASRSALEKLKTHAPLPEPQT